MYCLSKHPTNPSGRKGKLSHNTNEYSIIRRVTRDVNKAYFLDVVITLHTVDTEPSAIETSDDHKGHKVTQPLKM